MARHRHARVAAGGRPVHRHAGKAAGAEGRLPGGSGVPQGLHRCGAARAAGRANEKECLWPVPVAPAARYRFLTHEYQVNHDCVQADHETQCKKRK